MKSIFSYSGYIFALGLVLGVMIPVVSDFFNPYIDIYVMILFMIAFLEVDIGKIIQELKQWYVHLYLLLCMIVVLPLGLYYSVGILAHFIPTLQYFPLALLFYQGVALATGAPGVVLNLGGNLERILIGILLQSVCTIVTFPLMLAYFGNIVTHTSMLNQYLHMSVITFVPMAAAIILRLFFVFSSSRVLLTMKSISLIFTSLLFLSCGKGVLDFIQTDVLHVFYIWIISGVCVCVSAFFGWLFMCASSMPNRISSVVMGYFPNIGLAYLFASRWTTETQMVLILSMMAFWIAFMPAIMTWVLSIVNAHHKPVPVSKK
ncbi:MAG: hypothetical protein VXY77_02610 [Pseudomonadota bacterium]|nr:hypothetical protein [Pseudomonadota bacterium]